MRPMLSPAAPHRHPGGGLLLPRLRGNSLPWPSATCLTASTPTAAISFRATLGRSQPSTAHYWNPAWRYVRCSAATAASRTAMKSCNALAARCLLAPDQPAFGTSPRPRTNPRWHALLVRPAPLTSAIAQIGTRTAWTPVKNSDPVGRIYLTSCLEQAPVAPGPVFCLTGKLTRSAATALQ